jgi:superfamily II DNA or RNA helicase
MRYKFKTKPYAHQVRALRKLIKNGYGGELFMDPRTGKSKVTVDYASMLAQKRIIDKVLIVAPARVMHVWIEQFHLHSPLMVNITLWDKTARSTSGGSRGKREYHAPPPVGGHWDLHVVLVNYDAFSTPGARTKAGRRSRASGRFKIRSLLRKWIASTPKGTLMVLDESHRIAKPSGSAASMIVTMRDDPTHKLILTGTPITKAKKVHDLYMQYKFVNPSAFAGLTTADDFKNHFGRWIEKNGFPQWIGERNAPQLKQILHRTAVVVRREDCFDLPPRQTIIKKIPLTGKTARAYDEMSVRMVAEIIKARETHTVEATIKLVQGLRLRQITGGVATTDEGRLLVIGKDKLMAMRDDLEATIEHDEKIVIAAQFRADLVRIERLCASMRLPTYVLKGKVPLDQSARDIREFRARDDAAAFIVQPQSGSEGIDLSTAAHMVWYSLTPSYVKFTQMKDRIALSRTSTTFTYYLAEDTVDQVLYDTLLTDGEVARAILDKPQQLLRDPSLMDQVEAIL